MASDTTLQPKTTAPASEPASASEEHAGVNEQELLKYQALAGIAEQGQKNDLLDELFKQYFSAKIQKYHIMNQAGANLVYTHGARMANLLQLDEKQRMAITPFPSPTTIVQVNESQKRETKEGPAAESATKEAAKTPASKDPLPKTPKTQPLLQPKRTWLKAAAIGLTSAAIGGGTAAATNMLLNRGGDETTVNVSPAASSAAEDPGLGEVDFRIE